MHNAWKQGDINTAQEINKKLMPLHDALFCETSPGPLKYAASLLGICSSDARLPIVEIEEDSKLKVKNALKQKRKAILLLVKVESGTRFVALELK